MILFNLEVGIISLTLENALRLKGGKRQFSRVAIELFKLDSFFYLVRTFFSCKVNFIYTLIYQFTSKIFFTGFIYDYSL